ncbi:Hsp20/alpha crystallin family protein [Echinicola sediminis]
MGNLVKKPDLFPTVSNVFDDFFNRDIFNWHNENFSKRGTLPDVNVRETNDSFMLEVAAPGMEKKDFKVELENNMLIVSAEQTDQEEKTTDDYVRKEFNYHSFRRSFSLPQDMVIGDKIEAKYDNGILYISIPKSERAKVKPARRIHVK